MQKVLIVSTTSDSLRAEIQGWTSEGGGDNLETALIEHPGYTASDIPVGLIRSGIGSRTLYRTVVHAIADGWKLLAPPQEDDPSLDHRNYTWWLVKD